MPTTDAFPVHLAAGLVARRLDVDADRADVVEIVRAYDAVYARGVPPPAEETVTEIVETVADPSRDSWLILDGERPVGLGYVAVEETDEPVPLYWVEVFVTPHLPAAAGLEGALVAAMLDRVRGELDGSGPAEVRVGAGCMRDDERTRVALEAAGLCHDRTFWRLERRLDAPVEEGATPAGVMLCAVQDDGPDRALLHELYATTFARHFGTVETDRERWWATLRARDGFDLTQWWIATLDGRPVGFLMGDASRADDGGGYVRLLGVLEEARGRGIARALLLRAFAEHARRGWAWSQLTVDTLNETGAPQLYASVGMEPVDVIDLYRLTLRSGGQP